MLHRILADASRAINHFTGGAAGKTICWRVAMAYGPDCLFCRAISAILREKDHCRDEWSAQDTFDWLKSRK